MERKKLIYINIGLFIGLIALIIIFRKIGGVSDKDILKEKATPTTIVAPGEVKEPELYDIDKIKPPDAPAGAAGKAKVVSLAEVYKKYPKEDVGNNIVEGWARVKPEEKEKVIEELDKEIVIAKSRLSENPLDKKAKHALFIAETMKKLCVSNFDYRSIEKVIAIEKREAQTGR